MTNYKVWGAKDFQDLKLIQDNHDLDVVHVYAYWGAKKSLWHLFTVHCDMVPALFGEAIHGAMFDPNNGSSSVKIRVFAEELT